MRIFETYDELNAALDLAPLEPGAFRFAKQYAPAGFRCARCKQAKALPFDDGGTGYGITTESSVARGHAGKPDQMICYACCGETDTADMIATGKAVLYLTMPECIRGRDPDPQVSQWGKISNWPGTLSIPVHKSSIRRGRHNIARTRWDVWFTGPDGKPWHGVQYGDNLLRCRRVKA